MRNGIRQRTLALIAGLLTGISGAAFAVGGGLVFVHFKTGLVLLGAGLFVTIVVPTVIDRTQIDHEREEAAKEERLKSLYYFVELTHQLMGLEKSHGLRVTVLIVDGVGSAAQLKQLARFTCAGRQRPGTSTMFVHQGVAGRCCTKITTVSVDLDGADFIQWMLDYGFTAQEARQFEPRGAYLCSPVVNDLGEVIGALSLDAATSSVFTPDHISRVETLMLPFFGRLLTESSLEGPHA
jgi:hypothetical protein